MKQYATLVIALMKQHRTLVIALALLIVTLGVGYYLYSSEKHRQSELAQSAEQTLDPEASALAQGASPNLAVDIQLYRPGKIDPGEGFLHVEKRDIFETEDTVLIARQIVNEVLKSRPLFSEEARLRQIYLLEDGTAVVDVSRQTVEQLSGGVISEMAAIMSIARSLRANIDQIQQVRFLVEGHQSETFGGHVSIQKPFR